MVIGGGERASKHAPVPEWTVFDQQVCALDGGDSNTFIYSALVCDSWDFFTLHWMVLGQATGSQHLN